jgi:REP element-mobilizing transposase RayT
VAGTFSQIYIQLVFAVKGRNALIQPAWEAELHKYITGIITNKGQKLIAINGMPDHVHILIGMKPACYLADLVREIKKSSGNYVKEKGFTQHNFEWQSGYGAFSYSHSALGNVIEYINNQKEHHRKKTFTEEYVEFLEKFGVEFEKQYIFE